MKIPKKLDATFMIDYLSRNGILCVEAWDMALIEKDHIERELELITEECIRDDPDGAIMDEWEDIMGDKVSLPNFFWHRLAQRYYYLAIIQIENYKLRKSDKTVKRHEEIKSSYRASK